MKIEKFETEIETINRFFQINCKENHSNLSSYIFDLEYKGKKFTLNSFLCLECKELLEHSFSKLQNCSYEDKPKCRKCPTPCYEKKEWKKICKIMRFSAINLGLSKIKKFFKLSRN